jgi:hypothetical protein
MRVSEIDVMSEQDWDDFDAQCYQQQAEERRRRELDPALFTTPMPVWPRLSTREQHVVDMAQLKALSWALDKLFP